MSEYHMFYVSYQTVTYLLTHPNISPQHEVSNQLIAVGHVTATITKISTCFV
jgi:hypothetical protein